ncbi:MAG TPA: BT_3928 family protein [Cytophagaceae bacterium]|nr:BT_3928 family protein [Cytophagaceae bacterium]
MKLINLIFRILVGGLFIFSGLIKLNDPYGTAYKLEEYFEVFASDFSVLSGLFTFFAHYSLFFSIVICAIEVILGVAMLLNYRMRITMWVTLLMIVFFTFLTFYSYAFDKVKECGCFGTFIITTPKQSFYKDLVLLAMILVLFYQRNKFSSAFNSLRGDILMSIVSLISFGVGIFSERHLPFMDTLNYKVGNNIDSLKTVPKAEYIWIMEKDGKEFRFANDKYPTDTTYHFKKYEAVGDTSQRAPKITNFIIQGEEGDATKEMLTGKKLFILIPFLDQAQKNCDANCFKDIKELIGTLDKTDIKPVILTIHANTETFEEFRHEKGLAAPYYYMEDVILKTMVRSNPGFMILKDGVVKGKWAYHDMPDIQKIQSLLK